MRGPAMFDPDGMVALEQGEAHHPWGEGAGMTEAPWLHPTALVRDSRFGPWTVVSACCEVLGCTLAEQTYLMQDVQAYNAVIGKYGNVAARVRINPTNHPTWRASLHHFTYRSRSHHLAADDDAEIFAWRRAHRVTIGHDVWIGHAAILLPGVNVGTGAAIGAGAIVTRDVAPYTIVAGNPARMIRRRVDEATEAALARIAWWDWPRDRVAAAMEDFRRLDAAEFARKYDGDGSGTPAARSTEVAG